MKRIVSVLLIVLLVLIVFTLYLFAEEVKYDFRKTNWGMSNEQVREIEDLDEVLLTLLTFITTRENDSGTVYTIQVEAFTKEEDAQDLAKKLRGGGYLTHVTKVETLYEVQVEKFKSYEEAKSFSDRMEKDKELRKIIYPPGKFDVLRYEDYIWGFDCSIQYWFLEDKLYQGSYSLDKSILDEDPCFEDYEELKGLLIKKYGRSTMDKEEWKDDLSKRNELDRETAINKGCLAYRTGWQTPTTKIFMVILGYKNKTHLRIEYISKELEEWVEQINAEDRQKQEEEILKDF